MKLKVLIILFTSLIVTDTLRGSFSAEVSTSSFEMQQQNDHDEDSVGKPAKIEFKSRLVNLRKKIFGDKGSPKSNSRKSKSQKNHSLDEKTTQENTIEQADREKNLATVSKFPLHRLVKEGQFKQCSELLKQEAINEQDEEGKTLLHLGVEFDSEELCRELIQKNADLNRKDSDYNTPLHVACITDNLTLGLLLIKAGASHSSYNKKGFAPLHIAVRKGNDKLSLVLIHQEADLAVGTLKEGNTPLHLAAARGHKKTLSLLLELGARWDIKNNENKTVLDGALENGEMEIARDLAKNNRKLLIERAICLKCFSVLEDLISGPLIWTDLLFSEGLNALHVASVLPPDSGALREGLCYGGKKIVTIDLSAEDKIRQELILKLVFGKRRLNTKQVDTLGRTPLHLACEWNRENAVTLLLNNDPDKDWSVILKPCNKGYTALMLAVAYNYTPIVRKLLDTLLSAVGTSSFVCLYSQLACVAIDHLSLDVLVVLLSYKHKIEDIQDFEEDYLLHRACVKGDLAICTLLIEEYDDLNRPFIKDRAIVAPQSPLPCEHEDDRLTPLAYAAEMGHVEIVEILLKKGANINCKTKAGRSPFVLSAQNNKTQVAVFLLLSGASIDEQDLELADTQICKHLSRELMRQNDSNTSHERKFLSQPFTVQRLLSKKDREGKTILHREAERGNPERCELLLKFSAPLDAVDNDGRTPLHGVCLTKDHSDRLRYNGPCRAIQILVTHPTFTKDLLNKRDNEGKTAHEYATEGGACARVAIEFLEQANLRFESLPAESVSGQLQHKPIRWINEDNDPDVPD